MEATLTSGDDTYYVTLGIDQEVFAVPVEAVLEILDMRPVFRIPEAPGHLAGLIDVRGRAVPVIDLRTKLGLPRIAANENTRIVVLEVSLEGRQLVLGLIADRVFEVMALNDGQVEPAPDIGQNWRSSYIRGVGRRSDTFVVILDLAQLFSADEAVAIGASSASAAAAAARRASPGEAA